MHTETIDYTDGDITCEGFAAYDASDTSRRPCVIISHAWHGQGEIERAKAVELARLGYVGFAIDMYGKGVRGDPVGDNSNLMNPFMEDRAMLRRRIQAGVAAAKQHPRVDPDRIGAMGYCFGGASRRPRTIDGPADPSPGQPRRARSAVAMKLRRIGQGVYPSPEGA